MNREHMLDALSYLARTERIDRIVALDEFDQEVAAAVREHLRIPGMGETTMRYFRDKLAMRMRLSGVLTALSVVPPEQQALLRPLTRWLSERGRAVSGPEFGLAIGAMRRFAADCLATLAPYDAVLTPTLAVPPLPVGAIRDDDDPAADFEAQKAFTPWTSAWNVTGMPAVSLPLHWTPDGLPVGVMLAGRPAEEGLLLALATQVETASPWAERRPPEW